ncbi:hypothetical protein [uncultured Rothia sp.]|uniref:hypothetical protein n=1 Tax=uncultured Rothia sp. TaxID=316088 RepID=UPI003216E3E4
MTEYSFPVLEKPMNDQQWKSVTLGIGDGVFDEGGNPYNLINKNNATNTVTITVDSKKGYAHAILKGFYHKIDSDMTVSVPAVTSNTTFYIALVYDPFNANFPVVLKVITSLDRTSGKEYLILWKVERKPNQLLTDAIFTKFRQTIAPSIQVDDADSLPDSNSVLFGTTAHCLYTGEDYRASFNSWKPLNSWVSPTWGMGGWGIDQDTGGIAVTPVKGGYICTWSGGLGREAAGFNIPTAWGARGSNAGIAIPPALRPNNAVYALGSSGNNVIDLRITSAGTFEMRSMSGSPVYIPQGGGLSFSFTWFTSESREARA